MSSSESDKLVACTLNVSLVKCILIMLREHPDLYPWYLLIALVYSVVGGTQPAQAIIFSRLIRVFTLEGSEAKRQADFFALMFFVLALVNSYWLLLNWCMLQYAWPNAYSPLPQRNDRANYPF